MLSQSKHSYPAWLNDAAIYQIFPASFQDSNGDGIGDLPGITSRLDYIRELGCDTIWLCPIYDSPFRDAGYDVRNYRSIAPRFGTMADFEVLVSAIHSRGLRLILDFVPGHTSDEHPWFRESQRHAPNDFSERYVWSPTTFCGPGECDYSGDFIKGAAQRDGNYLANFFYFQPALNYGFADPDPKQSWQLPTNHPSVRALREEMHGTMRFWLDKGVDGFRVDMASSLIKGRDADAVRRETKALWAEIRNWWDQDYPDAALIAEWSNPGEAIETGLHLDFMIHFEGASAMKLMRGENERTIINRNDKSYFDAAGVGEAQSFLAELQSHLGRIGDRGLISVPTGNHDLPRYSVGRSEAEMKCLLTFLLTLPAVPTIYYGDEIGMRNLHDLPSKEGAYRRTGARTPMQWTDDSKAGFSTAKEADFYLPLDPSPKRPSVASQKNRDDSLLNHLKTLLRLRKARPGLGTRGSVRQINSPTCPYPLVVERRLGEVTHWIAVNPTARPVHVYLPEAPQNSDLLLQTGEIELCANCLKAGPFTSGIWEV